ncbi:MAG: acyl-ACP--UDP-N-acetylglucosamine O-acyltransferase [Deltaproteobacteria bacterium]
MENNFIHKNAKLGTNVQVGRFAYIDDNVEIGDNTIIYPNATILSGMRIGNNCRIFPGAVIGADPQDLKYAGEESYAYIGNNVTVREFVTINRGTIESQKTVIGDNCLLMAYVHVAHDCVIGNNCVLANSVNLAGHVHIGDYVIIGGLVGVHQFVHIGSHVMVAGGIVVRKDVPPYIMVGRESNTFEGVNSIGLKRRGFSSEDVDLIKDIYRIMFVKHNNMSKALIYIEENVADSEYKSEILNFARSASRGMIRGING